MCLDKKKKNSLCTNKGKQFQDEEQRPDHCFEDGKDARPKACCCGEIIDRCAECAEEVEASSLAVHGMALVHFRLFSGSFCWHTHHLIINSSRSI